MASATPSAHAEVALAHDELGAGDGRLARARGQARLRPGAQASASTAGRKRFAASSGPGRAPAARRRAAARNRPGSDCTSPAMPASRSARLSGASLAAGDGVEQDVDGHDARALARVPDDAAQAHAGVLRRGCHLAAHAQGAHGRLARARCAVQAPQAPRLRAARGVSPVRRPRASGSARPRTPACGRGPGCRTG